MEWKRGMEKGGREEERRKKETKKKGEKQSPEIKSAEPSDLIQELSKPIPIVCHQSEDSFFFSISLDIWLSVFGGKAPSSF